MNTFQVLLNRTVRPAEAHVEIFWLARRVFDIARQMSETVAQAFERFSALSEAFHPPHDALSDRARFCDHTEPPYQRYPYLFFTDAAPRDTVAQDGDVVLPG